MSTLTTAKAKWHLIVLCTTVFSCGTMGKVPSSVFAHEFQTEAELEQMGRPPESLGFGEPAENQGSPEQGRPASCPYRWWADARSLATHHKQKLVTGSKADW